MIASPISPTATVDLVMSYTWSPTAKLVSALPTDEAVVPAHSRLNAGDERSGLRSASSFTRRL
jgi:hypothetical protein